MSDGYLGIDLNGLMDFSVTVQEPLTTDSAAVRQLDLPMVVVSPERNARPLCGPLASESLEGRGWQWPTHSRVHQIVTDTEEPASGPSAGSPIA